MGKTHTSGIRNVVECDSSVRVQEEHRRKAEFSPDTHTHTHTHTHVKKARDWSDAATSERMPPEARRN